jgi:hypothetical protein
VAVAGGMDVYVAISRTSLCITAVLIHPCPIVAPVADFSRSQNPSRVRDRGHLQSECMQQYL